MTMPTAAVVTTNLDAGTDSPASARTDLLDAVQKLNQMIAHISTFAGTLLDDASASAARATLEVAPRATRIDVASAITVNLTSSAPDVDDIRITGTTSITAVTVAAGRVVRVTASAAHTLTNNANIVTQTGANIVCAAGDTYVLRATAANVVEVMHYVAVAGPPTAVLLTGSQTIAGVKTFSTQPVLPQASVLGVAIATTSGTSIDFTGIPSWVKKVTVLFEGVSSNGTSLIMFRLGAGSAQTTGYTTQSWSASAAGGLLTSGFFLAGSVAAANFYTGCITFVKITGNTWVGTGIHNIDNATNVGYQLSGKVALSGALDMIRLTTVGGTDAFDAGTCNVLYE